VEDKKKSGIQKLFTGVAPDSMAADMEAESRSWMVRCTYCGYERSVWETGGVKYKASGSSRQLRRCPNCSRLSWHVIYRKAGAPSAVPATMPLASPRRRWLLWVVGLGSLAAIVVAFIVILLLVLGSALQPVVTAGDNFMTALKTGDYAQAYALCTPDLQKELGSVAGTAALVQGHQPANWNWSSRSVRNGAGYLDGSLTYANGRTGTVHLVLNQVGKDWKIVSFRLNPS
jgi:hypothetical protein